MQLEKAGKLVGTDSLSWGWKKQHFNFPKTKSRYFFRCVLRQRDAFRLWWPETMAPTGNSGGQGSNLCSAGLRVIRAVCVYLESRPHSQPFSTWFWVRKGQSDIAPPLQKTVWTFDFHVRSKVVTTTFVMQWNSPSSVTPATGISMAYYPAPTVPAVHVSDLHSTKYSETKSSSEENWQSSSEVNRTLISTILE